MQVARGLTTADRVHAQIPLCAIMAEYLSTVLEHCDTHGFQLYSEVLSLPRYDEVDESTLDR